MTVDTRRQEVWAAIAPHRDRLLDVARGHGLDHDDAEDVVQDAMLRCGARAAAIEDYADLGPLLTAITRRLVLERSQRLERRAPRPLG